MTMIEPTELSIPINHYELIYAVDAFHEALFQKMFYALSPDHKDFRANVPLTAMQNAVSTFAALWGRAWALYSGEVVPEAQREHDKQWEGLRSIPDEAWDMITEFSAAMTWDEVPFHDIGQHGKCVLCERLIAAMVV